MKYIRYSKYSPEAAGDIDMQDLMSRLSDFFLQSGFESQYGICARRFCAHCKRETWSRPR
jgi:hypothetical protein